MTVLLATLCLALSVVAGAQPVNSPPAAAPPVAPGAQLSSADWHQISDLLYTAQPTQGGGAFFTNHANDLSVTLGAGGVRVQTGAGDVALTFTGVGRSGAMATVDPSAAAMLDGTTVSFSHRGGAAGTSEWWVNRPAGLEQGFTLPHRPTGTGELRLEFTLAGSLVPNLAAPDAITFAGSDLMYSGLAARDAANRLLPVSFTLDGRQLSIVADDNDAHYPLTIDPTFAHQQAYLKASNTDASDNFGISVAISGDTIVVGSPGEDSSATGVNGNEADNSASYAGAAYVFTRSGTTWSQQAYLKASNTDAGDNFGNSVAIDGDTIVVAAYGEGSAATGVNGNEADNSASYSGAAYVFTRSGTTWSQQAYLKASNTDVWDLFGQSVAISGDTIVVGARGEASSATGVNGIQTDNSASYSGAAYVFTRSDTTWSQQAYLKASNTDASDYFGAAVAISDDTIIVGANGEDSSGTGVNGNQADNSASFSGAAYVFARSGTTWSQQAYLKASNTDAGDVFGQSVAISGDTLVIGARLEGSSATGVNGNQTNNSAINSGAAYVFTRNGATWSQQAYLKASNTGVSDNFGVSLAISDDIVAVGAHLENSSATGVNANQADNSGGDSGAAYVFARSGTTWSQQAYIKASNTDAGDRFGCSVTVDGDTLAVSACEEGSGATGVNGNQTDNSLAGSGAAYVFFSCATPPFSDVPTNHPFCPEIEWMKDNAISTGFADGTYRPSISVTRQAMSAFMARLAGSTSLPACTTPPFSDVPTNHPFCPEIQWMKDNGISTGFDDGTYRPSIAVTREAMSAFMSRLTGVASLPACTVAPFTDVPSSHPFCPEIQWMKDNGISTGFDDGTYRPSVDVTRQAMSAFMYRLRPLLP